MHIRIQEHIIHYERYGRGARLLFCLHGYGERGADFQVLASALGNAYTIICPDLPLHGQTKWTSPEFELPDLHLIFSEIASTEGLIFKPFALAGYSMGGRLALAYAEQYTAQIKSLLLVAPDGLKLNFWYWLSTQTRLGNRLFRLTMKSARWLLAGMHLARKTGLLNESVYKFSTRYLEDPNQREHLYQRWTLFRHFRPKLKEIPSILDSNRIHTLLVFGKFDRIIRPSLSRKWRYSKDKYSKTIVLDAGHRLLKTGTAEKIASAYQSFFPE